MQGSSWAHFSLPTKLFLESGCTFKIGSYVKHFGGRVLLLSIPDEIKNQAEYDILKNGLIQSSQGVITYEELTLNPDSDQIDSATYFLKKSHADVIVAYGSTDTLNAAKAVAALANNSVFAKDLIITTNQLKKPQVPLITVPCEPCLGEEVSPSVIMLDSEKNTRHYIHHEYMFPSATFYDTKLAEHMTSDSAARLGGAMMVYCIESQLSPKNNVVSTALILRNIESIRKNLPLLYKDPSNEKHISSLLWTSLMTGMATIISPSGVSYAIANAINNRTNINFHDAITLVLPHVMENYLTAAPAQYINIARSLGEDVKDISVIEAAIKAVEGIRKLFLEINLPTRLSEFEIKKYELPDIATESVLFPHIENAPRVLNKNEIESILLAAF